MSGLQAAIFRDNVPAIDPAEPRISRPWSWVCAALVNRDKGECVLPIVDSVFIDKHKIWAWYYTNANGTVRRKAPRKLTAEHVLQTFDRIADATNHAIESASRLIAVCWFDDSARNSAPFFTEYELITFLGSLAPSNGSACLSAFIHPRGDLDPTCYANLEHEYVLHKNGRQQSKLFRVALGRQRIANMDAKLNMIVNNVVQGFVSFLERNKKCRVVRCVSLFLLATSGRMYLWRTRECYTIPFSPLTQDDPAPNMYDGPRAIDERLIQRAKAEDSRRPDDHLIEAILSSPTPHRKAQLLPSSQSQPQLRQTEKEAFNPFQDDYNRMHEATSRFQLQDSSDWEKAMKFLPPSSKLSRGRRRALSAAHLMLSQKRGCGGDYCNLSVHELATKRIARGSKPISGSPLLSPMGMQSTNEGTLGTTQRHSSVVSATAAANAFLAAQQAASASRRGSEFDLKPGSPQRQQRQSRGNLADGEKDHTIPFKLIAQTRAEKQLVDLFIRRYQNGEDGDYLAEAYYGDGEPLGETFPGYYYQEVRVCRNCYELYNLVEQVRMRALDRITRNSKEQKARREEFKQERPKAVNFRPGGSPLRLLPAIVGEDDERDEDESDSFDNDPLEFVWCHVWARAQAIVSSISKRDAAELYSFVNPHPAVAMVFSGLSVLLLGKDGDAGAVKRAISQEKLLTTLLKFSADRISVEVLMKGAGHARNPLFKPENVEQISACAAKFCEWFLTSMQALAWKLRAQMHDKETCRLLCFLNPNCLPPGVSIDAFLPQSVGRDDKTFSHSKHSQATVASRVDTMTSRTEQRQAARRSIQIQQMTRLSAPAGLVTDPATGSAVISGGEKVFTCQDGRTRMPYAIVGQAVAATSKCNLVVFHDFFDTLDGTRVQFRSILARNVGSRVLVFNFPGQANTSYPIIDSDTSTTVLNNTWTAQRVHELLSHLQQTQEFITRGLPFHLVGFGNGANIAACYASMHGKSYGEDLRSVTLFNGFARVDAQLAAILHSAVNVFTCLPPARPDLPVSFFGKFLFSDAYLRKVDLNLALSIYTAVTNSITLDGRIRVCQGALHHTDLSPLLAQIETPLVLVQSVENVLVAPTNVDPFLQGRSRVLHAWSHQQSHTSDLRGKTRLQLRQTLETPQSAFVSWLRAGHELRQEAKTFVMEVLEFLVNADEEPSLDEIRAMGEAQSSCDNGVGEQRENDKHLSVSTSQSIPAGPQIDLGSPFVPNVSRSTPIPASKSHLVRVEVTASESSKTRLKENQVRKSAYELQLERSEREFQEAVRTHEAQKAELEKRAWIMEEKKRERQQQMQSPTSATEKPATIIVESPIATMNGPSAVKIAPISAHPTIPPTVTNTSSAKSSSKPTSSVPSSAIDDIRAKLAAEQARVESEAAEMLERQRAASEARLEALRQEQEERRRKWEEEDRARLAVIEQERREQEAERTREVQRREQERLARDLETMGAPFGTATVPLTSVQTISAPAIAPTLSLDAALPSLFDQMEAEEEAVRNKKRVGQLNINEFAAVREQTQRAYSDGVRSHESSLREQLQQRKVRAAVKIQSIVRRAISVRRVKRLRERKQRALIRTIAGAELVRIARGFLGRRRFIRHREARQLAERRAHAAVSIQKLIRGFVCRMLFGRKLRAAKAGLVQRVYRGHKGRQLCHDLRIEREKHALRSRNAAKLQATWRMHIAREKFLRARFATLAATELQRVYRGHVGRCEAKRKKEWRDASPGAERLALGLRMIEGSKQAVERQQHEIDALHRAQEQVEYQVSSVHAELQASEQELAVLERELQEIDQLDADLRELTHEADMLRRGQLGGIAVPSNLSASTVQPLGDGITKRKKDGAGAGESPLKYDANASFESREDARQRQADLYALEMAMQIKRGEREKKKKDLEAEFASVFGEVQQKRAALAAMEERLADMEATRLRKDREFARLQRQLMELLEEQKLELERLREKGIELETATATSAAAAAATAAKAREHEQRSQAMFESTEELMRFQFMSMSLSYFSSLNMLKNLRDINADTTAAAITSTAETAAAAAAAAAAANIPPSVAKLSVGAADLFARGSAARQQELELAKARAAEDAAAEASKAPPMPEDVRAWTVDDVGRWLESLSLMQYAKAFREGSVDGAFLLELRAEDMADILGVTHPLHVRKLMVARDRLRPLSEQERVQLAAVQHEQGAAQTRAASISGVSEDKPSLDVATVFSQARNGRSKRLVESLEAGFDIDTEDDKGNTLLIVACQNVNRALAEMLVARRANVNHRNAQGNTPLHFAMAYDTDGALGEFLIAHGADDTIENSFGLTPYDGLSPD